MSTNELVYFKLPATHRNLAELEPWVNSILANLKDVSDPDLLRYNLLLAVHEVCANIVDHAYEGSGGQIHITFSHSYNPRKVVVELEDNGRSFDITNINEPKLGELQERGLGLFLVRQLVDEVMYAPFEGGNRWRLTKYF